MIPEGAVEAAAKVLYARGGYSPWDKEDESVRSRYLRTTRLAFEAAGPHMLSDAWEEGFRACQMEWEQTSILVTPDEDRFVARNPYR